MPRHFAFLRAVNVGGRYVKMAELRSCLETAGFTDVETHIQTGNVALTSTMRSQGKVEAAIEECLGEWAGFEIPTMVRSPDEFADLVAAVESTPPLLSPTARRYVAFAKGTVSKDAEAALTAYRDTSERSCLVGRDVLLEIDLDFNVSKLAGARLERLAGTPLTARDLKVVRAIDEKWSTR
ncbi:DUF1697 domain-containing protein [Knoellia subterranea]|uniref:DUF1697 domain-containing protein n=1 Tax=Knoellia subterranea KCTC 19937 TaxID=1385521 RepID=A0A0A0JPF7_9MICO|nr:DUF1697 domain-containing protein [Knoellia subterranea]KGN38644.1 hypothetical protein N803_07875 [Knoellia subterranea KCTC 19937]